MAISNRIGPPVTGDDFYGRQKELSIALNDLSTRHSLLLSAPRRVGKSSLAMKIIEEEKAAGWKCVYIDLEGISTQNKFLSVLIDSLDTSGIFKLAATSIGSAIGEIARSIKSIGSFKIDFATLCPEKDLYYLLSEAIDHNEDTLIVIDELPLFLSIISREEGDDFQVRFLLNWFRSLRQVPNTKVRWIFCGSVGLANFTSMRNLSSTINDLKDLEIGEMSDEEATGLVSALATSSNLNLTEECINHIILGLQWNLPYFIQLIINSLKQSTPNIISFDDIDAVIDDMSRSRHLSSWAERMSEYGEYEDIAMEILKIMSSIPNGLTKQQLIPIISENFSHLKPSMLDTKLSKTLGMLEHDGYIIRKGPVRLFRSPLIRKWWFNNFVE